MGAGILMRRRLTAVSVAFLFAGVACLTLGAWLVAGLGGVLIVGGLLLLVAELLVPAPTPTERLP